MLFHTIDFKVFIASNFKKIIKRRLVLEHLWYVDTKNTTMGHDLTPLQKQFESYINIAAGAGSAPIVVSHLFLGHLASVKNKSLFALVSIS